MQILINGIITGSVYILVALGFTIIYRTVKFFHFAHGIIFAGGAYYTFLFYEIANLPLSLSILLAVLSSMCSGCLIEIGVYSFCRKKFASDYILLLASFGMYILLQNIISIIFGDKTLTIKANIAQQGIDFIGARITPIQVITILISASLVLLVALLLKKTKIGFSIRAVATDMELADISGIPSNIIILWTFAIGSALASIGGILVALDTSMTPTMGMGVLMMAVVSMIVGGIRSISGIALSALLLALTQHFGIWYVGSHWQDAIAFIVLILVLLFKPEGFFGEKVKRITA